MSEQVSAQPVATRGAGRAASWPLAVVAATVLVLSRVLHPDPHGFGTHQQLLLPPCLFHRLTGVPCPFCGMTTGFAHMARGEWLAAARSNLLAPVGFAVTVLLLGLGLYGTVADRDWQPAWLRTARGQRGVLLVCVAFWGANLALHFAGWAY